MRRKGELLEAMHRELDLRKHLLQGPIESIYFGGGTPSLLSEAELESFLDQVAGYFSLAEDVEVTLEANPDDLNREKLEQLRSAGINRLSLGIQSFFEKDLVFMNRAHNSEQASRALEESCELFENISIDLIYGLPGMSAERWEENLESAFSYPIKHLSSYALTVEPRTALRHLIETGKCQPLDEEMARLHFEILVERSAEKGFVHYEISNFGKEPWFSRHNTSYWKGSHYLGIGPSAHSYLGRHRSWNVSNNARYVKGVFSGLMYSEQEELTRRDRANERIMTGLRTMWGVSMSELEKELSPGEMEVMRRQLGKYLEKGLLELESGQLKVRKKGMFLVDGIASDLFVI